MNDIAPLHFIAILAVAVLVVLTIAALITTVRDKGMTFGTQVGWALILIFAPVVGLPVWAFFWQLRRRKANTARAIDGAGSVSAN